MQSRPWLRYVHWFGYFATAIIALQLIFLSYVGLSEWKERQDLRDQTRMQQGPATPRLHGRYGGEAEVALLDALPQLKTLRPDGIRFVATPFFGVRISRLRSAARRTPDGGDGVMLVVSRTEGGGGPRKVIPIKLPLSDYDKLVGSIDRLSDEWAGEASRWTDGTGVVLERVRNAEVTSGIGNSPNFHDKVGALLFDAVRPVTPELARFDSSWHPRDR